MTASPAPTVAVDTARPAAPPLRALAIGLIAFLTLVDLFATQAILPALARAYGVGPAAMGLAVNASTLGMAIAGLAVAGFAGRLDRRRGVVWSLAALAVPTALLAAAPDLATFAALRIVQGLLMAAAFTLTLAYLGEHFGARDAAGLFAAYITGNVASNLVGRMVSAAAVDQLGIVGNFELFAALNLAGALLARLCLDRAPPMDEVAGARLSPLAAWRAHLSDPGLRASFAIGFLILFAFIGTFTYVNFVLVAPPYAVDMMTLGIVYLVFLPSIVTTPLAGRAVRRFGTRPTLRWSLAAAIAGLPLLLAGSLPAALAGLVLVGVGTFFAQATATGHVGRIAAHHRGAASGLYLASYFLGGLVGTAALGIAFDRLGWTAAVTAIGLALGAAILLGRWIEDRR